MIGARRVRGLLGVVLLLTVFSSAAAAQLTLTWTDNAAGQAWFVVERALGQTGPFASLATTPFGVVAYDDTTVEAGTTYCYRVAAANAGGQSTFSNVACGMVAVIPTVTIDSFTVLPTTITAGQSATVTWATSNATVVTLNGATVPADGILTVSPTTTTNYDLLADSVSSRVTLTVTQPPPPPTSFMLTVAKTGGGLGTVTSSPGGIVCGAQCAAPYLSGTVVTLTATPRSGARFSGWSGGGCSGTGLCRVTVTLPITVTATFTKGGKK